jgi:hypothetical protein
MREHRYDVGQYVRYIERGLRGRYLPDFTDSAGIGGYQIIHLLPADHCEPQYQIHHVQLTNDRVVGEGQLCEDRKAEISRSTGEFFLLWAKLNVAMTRELQPTWTRFVSALEAELGRKNYENHQLRQSLASAQRREAAALQQIERANARERRTEAVAGDPSRLTEIEMIAHAANRAGLWIGRPGTSQKRA